MSNTEIPTLPFCTQPDEDLEMEKPTKKRARKEQAEFTGTDSELEASFLTLKALFTQHPEAFNEWLGGFTEKMVKFEKRFQQPKEFFLKLSTKQKSVIYNSAKQLEASIADAGKSVVPAKGGKRKQINSLSEEDYQLAWDCLKHMANPLTSAVEFNYLCNIALRLREYKSKALLSEMELQFLKRIAVSIPERKENKSYVVETKEEDKE
jgi:hypothetical protein